MPYYRAGYLRKSRHKTRARRHASGVIGRAWRNRKKNRKVKSNRQLTKAVRKLWAAHEIKFHYVDINNSQVSDGSPDVTELTGIGAGTGDDNTHAGDKIRLRGLNIHGRVKIGNSGGVPEVNGPTTYTILVVSSTLGTGLTNLPSFSDLYRPLDGPVTEQNFALTDSFRLLKVEDIPKVKILKKVTFMLEPHGPWPTVATQLAATYPSAKKFSMSVMVRNTQIDFRPGTATALNRRLFMMIRNTAYLPL